VENLSSIWTRLSGTKRLVVIGATVAMFAAIIALSRGVSTRDMSLLYAGLESGAAGEVVTALEQRGVAYEVRGSAIYVDASQRDTLRLTLASEGLPANGAQGYELLDNLSGFGTTAQMFDAAYWRAKEGELARTIVASPHIRTARVHISSTTGQPFQRNQDPSAAVTVTSVMGTLDPRQAEALRFLVASAVPGLDPAKVAVIDGDNGLVGPAEAKAGLADESDRARELRERVERLLAARVGAGNAVVEVSVETVTETETILERRIDPDSRVAISSETEENAQNSQDTGPGDVTVASNLPDGDAEANGGQSTNQNTQTRALTNYEVSETQREVLRGPGEIRRLSVAVLVNAPTETAADGTVTVIERSPEELESLRALVGSAVGFNEARGDVITIESMPFEPVSELGSGPSELPGVGASLDIMRLVQTAILAAVALVLGLFVVRPVLSSRASGAAGQLAPPVDFAPAGLPGAGTGADPLAIGDDGDGFGGFEMNNAFDMGDFGNGVEEAEIVDPVGRLRQLIEERQSETVQVLRQCMEDPGETA